MFDREYAKVTITVETSKEIFTYEMPRVAEVEYDVEMNEPDIDDINPFRTVLVGVKKPLLKRLVFIFKPEQVDGKYMTVSLKKSPGV